MKVRKQLLLLCLYLVFLFAALPVTVLADGNATISFSLQEPDRNYMVGDTVNIDVNLSNNPGALSKVLVSVSYDTSLLQYTGISFKNSIFSTWSTKLWNATPQQIWMATNSTAQLSSANGLVCTLSFKALAATQETRVTPSNISMNSSTASLSGYRYGSEAVSFPIAEYTASTIPVSGITLNRDAIMLVEDQSLQLLATVTPENATDPSVSWSSNNKSVATVDQYGTVTAHLSGNAVITAKAGQMSARCQVSVQAKTPDVKRGYIVDLDTPERNVAPGSVVPVTIQVDAGTDDKNNLSYYNAVDMTVAYDNSKLTYLGLADNGADFKVTEYVTAGAVRIQRFGNKMAFGNALTLNFQTAGNATGSALIAFSEAYVDKGEKAAIEDAPPATMRNREITLLIGTESAVYRVVLPQGYEASNAVTASPQSDYIFSVTKDNHYNYVVKATIGGNTITLSDKNGDGQYVIPANKITGDIALSVEKTPRSYSVVTIGDGASDVSLDSGNTVTYGKPYTFSVKHADGYNYTVVMTAGGTRLSGINPTVKNGVYTYTIPGDSIIGTVSINVSKIRQGNTGESETNQNETNQTESNKPSGSGGTTTGGTTGGGTTHSGGGSTYTGGSGSVLNGQQTGGTAGGSNALNIVTLEGLAKDLIDGPTTINSGEDYTFKFKGDNKDDYIISATIDGKPVEIIDNEDGTYTIKEVSGNLQISVIQTKQAEKSASIEIKIYRYVKLDTKDMYLITASGSTGYGNIFVYDENPMYYSDKYGAYCYLVISDQDETQIMEAAKKLVRTGKGNPSMISYDGDVNGSKRVDANDMQLVYNMYNAEFDDFTTEASMLKFLKADLSSEKTSQKCLDVCDALAVQYPGDYTVIELPKEEVQSETEVITEPETEPNETEGMDTENPLQASGTESEKQMSQQNRFKQ